MKRTFRLKNRKQNQLVQMESGPSSGEAPIQLDPSNPDIETRLDFLQQQLADCSDVVTHTFLAGPQLKCALIYLHGMIDVKMLQKDILQSILAIRARNASAFTHAIFVNKQLPVSDYRVIPTTEGISSILEGNVLLLIDGESQALEFPISSVKKRQISEPPNEMTVRGPRESFFESVEDNLTLLRKRIKTPDFKTETMRLGTKTQTKVLILYIKDVCKVSHENRDSISIRTSM